MSPAITREAFSWNNYDLWLRTKLFAVSFKLYGYIYQLRRDVVLRMIYILLLMRFSTNHETSLIELLLHTVHYLPQFLKTLRTHLFSEHSSWLHILQTLIESTYACLFCIFHFSPLEEVGLGISAQNVKLSELSLQIACLSYCLARNGWKDSGINALILPTGCYT